MNVFDHGIRGEHEPLPRLAHAYGGIVADADGKATVFFKIQQWLQGMQKLIFSGGIGTIFDGL
jgi:hypothetical protein